MNILYEDNHLIAVNKQCSEIVQGDKTGDISMMDDVKAYIKKKYDKPGDVFLGLIHRLDRPTSGVVVFARTSKALSRMNEMFRDGKDIKKTYWAVVDCLPPNDNGTLTHYLEKNEAQNRSHAYNSPKGKAKKAVLHYKLKARLGNYYVLEVEIETGRHHQIRAQLAKIGCHIKGDLKYGAKRSNRNGGIMLHARKLEFIHPVKKETITILADPPFDNVWNDVVDSVR